MLRCYAVTMLRLRVDFLHVPNEMRPLSHGITAAFGVQLGVPLYTERNETAFAVLSSYRVGGSRPVFFKTGLEQRQLYNYYNHMVTNIW